MIVQIWVMLLFVKHLHENGGWGGQVGSEEVSGCTYTASIKVQKSRCHLGADLSKYHSPNDLLTPF